MTTHPSGPRVHHVAISVGDLDATASWYHEMFGCREEFRYEVPEMGLRAVFLARGTFRIEAFQVPGSRPVGNEARDPSTSHGARGLQHVALTVDDLDAVREDLQGRGVRFVNEVMTVPGSGGARFCLFLDPDGVLLELVEPAPPTHANA